MLTHPTKSPLIVAAPLAAAALSGLRWFVQGSGNVYTDLSKQRYVPDPDLGWRLTDGGPIWLGLDLIAFLIACAIGLGVVGFLLIRREQDRSRQWPHLRRLLWTGSLVTLLVPAIAFATGFGASDARDTLPEGLVSVPVGGVSGSLDAPVGHYQVVTHRGTQLVATLRAGGEDFEARFPALAGSLRFDPSDLLQPMQIDVRAQASSVDTGIDLRSKHAREELKVESNTFVEFRLGRLLAAEPRDGGIAFSATGEVTLVGRKHAVEVTGTIELADADAQKRLQTAGPTLLVRAALNIDIAETVIGNDGTFDQNKIPISVSLVLVHTSKEAPK